MTEPKNPLLTLITKAHSELAAVYYSETDRARDEAEAMHSALENLSQALALILQADNTPENRRYIENMDIAASLKAKNKINCLYALSERELHNLARQTEEYLDEQEASAMFELNESGKPNTAD